MVLKRFQWPPLCVDELHPVASPCCWPPTAHDLPVAFALVAANDQGHMEAVPQEPQELGLNPTVVVTDGSNLYPTC